jgi:hypothetical protein
MTRDDIIRMAREANFYESEIGNAEDSFVDFAALVAAAEREACAKVLDEMADYMESEMEPSETIAWIRSKAAMIRARGEA